MMRNKMRMRQRCSTDDKGRKQNGKKDMVFAMVFPVWPAVDNVNYFSIE
jgi:hypothetical protein